MEWTRKLVALALALPAFACALERPVDPVLAASSRGALAAELEVRYLANEGFLIRHGDHAVLIDALFGEGIPGYPAVPSALRADLEQGASPWGGVRLALATHFHGDHFDPPAVARFLSANPQAVFVSTPQAAESFRQSGTASTDLLGRFRGVLPEPGTVIRLEIEGVRLEVLNLHHGVRDPPVENLGFVVTLGERRFIHFGDTEAKMEDFEPYLELLAEPDLALLPFWFLASEWRAELVRERLRPGRIAIAHLPTRDAPADYFARWQSYDALRALLLSGFPDAWLPEAPGDAMPEAP